MVMGKTHITSGLLFLALFWTVVATAGYGAGLLADPRTPLVCSVVCAAGFLRPDIDHPRSIATRCFGEFSRVECAFWRHVSREYYAATRLAGDSETPRVHRGFTHSPPGAVCFGLLAGLAVGGSQQLSAALDVGLGPVLRTMPIRPLFGDLTQTDGFSSFAWALLGALGGIGGGLLARGVGYALAVAGAYPVVGVLFVAGCLTLVVAAYAWRHRLAAGVLGAALALVSLPVLQADWLWVAVSAAVGCYGHDLGDGCTNDGAPLKHPKREYSEGGAPMRWKDHGTPWLIRFPAGSRREIFWKWVLIIAVVAACVTLAIARFTAAIPALVPSVLQL